MRTKTWAAPAILLSVTGMSHAQTYDVDITMTGVKPGTITFEGSFTFNSAGNGFCSPPFCGTGVTPDFSNIKISDPLLGTDFTAVSGVSQGSKGGTLTLVDFEGEKPSADSSEVFTLNFSFGYPLGGKATSQSLSDVRLQTIDNVSGIYACGQTDHVTCPTASLKLAPASAPEIDPASAACGLVLLFGSLAVMRGRRGGVPSAAGADLEFIRMTV